VADFTYVSTWAGTVYTAFGIDVFSRRIVGWTCSMSKETDLVLDAIEMGLRERSYRWKEGEDRLVHHSDAGSQYQCHLVKPVCADERVSWSPVDVLRSEFGPQEAALASRTCSGR
jgi:transposase InsO family protein